MSDEHVPRRFKAADDTPQERDRPAPGPQGREERMSDQPRILGGRYELGGVIGRGGMALVSKARDLRLGRDVAVKELRIDLATDPTFQARFRREAQAAAGLNHPNIVSVYDTGEELDPTSQTQVPYIVMELVQGRTLRDILREGRPILPRRALEFTVGVLEALAYSHKAGIIHRDIKPANVMLASTGIVKVMDFGIARAVSDTSATMTQTAAVIGTAQYLSPEQARGEQVDARSDIYSAGCLLYELLTGRPPFIGDSPVSVAYQHVREIPIPPSQLDAEITAEMDAVTMKALAKATEDRYQSAKAMRDDCIRLLNGQSVTAQIPAVVAASGPASASAAPTRALPAAEDPDAYYTDNYDDDELDYEEQPEQSRRRVSPATLVLIALMVLLLGALAVFAVQLFRPDPTENEVQVPTVVGFEEEAARETLTLAQLNPVVERVPGPAEGKGTVISQDPEGGQPALVGSTVTITVNDGPPVSTIPAGLLGKPQEEAVALLKDAGFNKVELLPATSDLDRVGAKKGEVVKVDPEEGEDLATDQLVKLYVASGKDTVPDVTGQPEAEARRILTEAGYTNISAEYVPHGREPIDFLRGQVVETSPAAGNELSTESPIVLRLATGESVMTNLLGMTRDEAEDELKARLGFTNVHFEERESAAEEAGKVVGQSVPANEARPREYAITITIGQTTLPPSDPTSAPTDADGDSD